VYDVVSNGTRVKVQIEKKWIGKSRIKQSGIIDSSE
jgi:hypothetical protein